MTIELFVVNIFDWMNAFIKLNNPNEKNCIQFLQGLPVKEPCEIPFVLSYLNLRVLLYP